MTNAAGERRYREAHPQDGHLNTYIRTRALTPRWGALQPNGA